MYPPFLDKIHDHCPKAAKLYTLIWRNRRKDNVASFTKEKVVEDLTISWKTFNHDLLLLKREKVITYIFNDAKDQVKIHLIIPSEAREKAA